VISQFYNILPRAFKWTIQQLFDPLKFYRFAVSIYIGKVKIKNIIQSWSKRSLTLFGKVTIIKSLIVPQLTYLLSVLPNPGQNYLKDIDSLITLRGIFSFVFNSKKNFNKSVQNISFIVMLSISEVFRSQLKLKFWLNMW
jgi:hypothetical protein